MRALCILVLCFLWSTARADSISQEGRDRFLALENSLLAKTRYQLQTQTDERNYLKENHELALWYAKALLRARITAFLRESRAYLGGERAREASRRRGRIQEASGVDRSPAGAQVLAGDADSGFQLEALIENISHFVDRITNSGVRVELPFVSSLLRLNPQSSVASAEVQSDLLNLGFSYRVLPPSQPVPFSGNGGDPNGERLVMSAGQSIEPLGLWGGVTYQWRHAILDCSISKHLWDSVNAGYQRTWAFGGLVTWQTNLSWSRYF